VKRKKTNGQILEDLKLLPPEVIQALPLSPSPIHHKDSSRVGDPGMWPRLHQAAVSESLMKGFDS
jgi:hypothetical protein